MTTVELEPIRSRLAGLGRVHTAADVAAALRAEGTVVTDAVLLETLEVLRRDSVGAGILEPLLRLPGVTDVIVNGPDEVYVDVGDGLRRTELTFTGEAEVRRLAQRLAASVGRRLDDASPYVDARLLDGTRVHAVLGTLAAPGTCLSLRIPADRSFSLADCVASGSVSEAAADLMIKLVESRSAFLISGGTGSGKTTLLAALLGLVPASDRIVIAEDSRELASTPSACGPARGPPGERRGRRRRDLTDLVRQALRMRPDRLVVGEVRGAEVCDLLAALNTGHEGGCGTVHANAATQVPARLEALAALGGMDRATLHAQLAAAVELVVHLVRDRAGQRRVSEIATLAQDPATGLVIAEPALIFDREGPPRRGPSAGRLERLLERS